MRVVLFAPLLLFGGLCIGTIYYASTHKEQFIDEETGVFHLRRWGNNKNSSSTTIIANEPSSSSSFPSSTAAAAGDSNGSLYSDEEIEAMRQRLSPRELIEVDGKLLPHQFLHLHHMKTGGTSMDGLIHCGMKRLQRQRLQQQHTARTGNNNNKRVLEIPYQNIHECSESHYAKCRTREHELCWQDVQAASILSYCAPFSDLPLFQWTNENSNSSSNSHEDILSAVTVLRHPVNRVWSMYRFRTKACYKCRTLKEVYESIDNGRGFMGDAMGTTCANQIMNHQTRNLASSSYETILGEAAEWSQEHVHEAITNLQERFTMVGLTEDMKATAQIVGHAFPWLAETLPVVNASSSSSSSSSDEDDDDGSSTTTTTTTTCPMPRKNTSPTNNRCGPGQKHMPLPDHPDEETARLIEEHNQLDLQVYKAAVQQFELQKLALGID